MEFEMVLPWYVATAVCPAVQVSASRDHILAVLSSPQVRIRLPLGLTTLSRMNPSCARVTTEEHVKFCRFHTRISPSQLPLISGAPARLATETHFTESRWPERAFTNGFANIFSIFTATNARWYSRERSSGCNSGS